MIRVQAGGHVPIVLKAREVRVDSADGRLFNLFGATIKSIKDPNGTALSQHSNQSMLQQSTGVYVYHWNTSSITVYGDYLIQVETTVNLTGTKARKDVIFRLVKQGAS